MREISRLIITLLCVLAGASAACAFENAPVRDIFYEGTIILDPEGRFIVEEALAKADARAGLPRQRVPAGGNVYWLVESIANPDDVPTWWVEVYAARSDYIDLYVIKDGAVEQHIEGGLIRQATEERMLKSMGSHVFPFTLLAGDERTLALRVKSRSLINYSIKAGPDYALNNSRVYRHFFVYSLMGGMLFLILYNLFLGIALRDADYFLYSAHGISYFFFFFNSYGFAATLLGWTAHPWITVFAGLCIEIFGIGFVWRFLRVREWSTVLSWLMIGCLAFLFAAVIATPFVGYLVMAEIWMVSYALVPFLVLVAATIGIFRGVHQSLYILLGWTPMVAMTFIAIVAMLGYLDRPPSGAAINASVLLEMLVLSLALADRVRRLRGERERAIEEGREKSTFLAMLSHEVRTPLNGIMGTVELLGRTRLSIKQKTYVENLQNAGNALMSLLNDVLQLAKSASEKPELRMSRVNLIQITQSMCDLMSARADEKALALSLRTYGEIPIYLEADEARLRQVLLNLIGNAVKFTDQGEVVVSLRGHSMDGGGARVEFEVRDTGIGVSPKDLDTLFQPFVQVGEARGQSTEGTGLGLSICQDLVQTMGGELAVESRPGQGSRFFFSLEFAPAPEDSDSLEMSAATEVDEEAVSGASAAGLSVLVVDDVALNRDVLKELLQHFGYSVTVAKSGEEALRCAKTTRFDAITADVFMPGMDGLELARRLAKYRNGARLIGLTAAFSEGLRRECLSVGFDLVLAKPISGDKLNRSLLGLIDPPRSATLTQTEKARVFDPRYLEGYFATLGTNRAMLLVETFRKTIDLELARVADAGRQSELGVSAKILHKLGGALSTIGLLKGGRSLEEKAMLLRAGQDIDVDWDAIRADVEDAIGILEAYVDKTVECNGAVTS